VHSHCLTHHCICSAYGPFNGSLADAKPSSAVNAGARASPYVALRLLFPDLVPVIARVAMRFPDPNLAKVMQVSC
jgi:hypothetical protein